MVMCPRQRRGRGLGAEAEERAGTRATVVEPGVNTWVSLFYLSQHNETNGSVPSKQNKRLNVLVRQSGWGFKSDPKADCL